jgi:DNA-binding MarR family transcriptional regulator
MNIGARSSVVNLVSSRYYAAVPRSSESGRQLAELALQVGRLAYGDGAAGGLTPAQWTALRYFARANRFSRTVSAFADFHATTRGTASQTVKSLVNRGYLRGTRSERDGRSTRFDLTPASRRLLADDPIENVVRAAEQLDSQQRAITTGVLRSVVERLAGGNARPVPGRCALCGYLLTGAEGSAFRCGLLKESLQREELEEFCIRFVAAPVAP